MDTFSHLEKSVCVHGGGGGRPYSNAPPGPGAPEKNYNISESSLHIHKAKNTAYNMKQRKSYMMRAWTKDIYISVVRHTCCCILGMGYERIEVT